MSAKSRKRPLERKVTIVLDDECLDALDEARTALAQAEQRADLERERRTGLLRGHQIAADDVLAVDTRLNSERDTYLQPYRDAVEAAEAAVREASEVYTFRSIGRSAYEALIKDHPPTDEDHEAARRDSGQETASAAWNGETFAPALVQASCIDPKLDDEDIAEIFTGEAWNSAEIADLFAAAIAVNTQRRVADVGKARG